jgi:hypothetical protein
MKNKPDLSEIAPDNIEQLLINIDLISLDYAKKVEEISP